VLVVNGAVVGWAVARAGLGLAAYLPHLPLEWGAIAIGAGTWLAFRREAPSERRPALLRALAATLGLLFGAALVEAYLVPIA
jgi:Stage II sporulation protein M